MDKIKEQVVGAVFLLALAVGFCMFLLGLLPDGGRAAGISHPTFTGGKETRQKRVPERPRGAAHTPRPTPLLERVEGLIDGAEPGMNTVLDKSNAFIQIYGGVQRLTGRRVLEDAADPRYTVVRMDDGSVTFLSDGGGETEKYAQRVWRLKHVLELREVPLLYIQAPQKVPDGAADGLPYGVTDGGNAAANDLLAALEELGVDTLDLRTVLADQTGDWGDWFFDTDHHWTPEAGFLAYQTLCDVIETYTYTVDTPDGEEERAYKIYPEWRDEGRFTKTTYADYFLGSQGKRVGSLYAGVDDITVWEPDFLTWFTHTSTGFSPTREGPFGESLLFPERIARRDLFGGNPYTLYSGGDYSIAHIDNHFNENGPRIMLLRDSYACVVTPFLALACSKLITIDLRHFNDNLMTYISWLQPDLVFVMYTPGATSNDDFFDFFHQVDYTRPPFPHGKGDDNVPIVPLKGTEFSS